MRIAIMTDLHIGYTGESRWHNRKMWTQAPDVALAAVRQINTLSVDRVMVLGDITESGTEAELDTAAQVLSELTSPWFVLSGNHDRAALLSGDFERIFAGHVPAIYEESGQTGTLCIREPWPREDRNVARMDWTLLEPEIARICSTPPQTLVIFAHYPLLPEREHAEAHNGLYAGHWQDGAELLNRLRDALSGRVLCFCGHQHWHHIMRENNVLHCTTASLIEYPMECRLITLTPDHVAIETLATASPETAQASLDGAAWVHGEEVDRVYGSALPLKD